MLRNIFLALVVVVAINTTAYAQDEAVVVKGMSFYICGGTGNINPGAGGVLDAFSEMGVTYSQNFASAPWITISTTAAMCGAVPTVMDDDEFLGSKRIDYAVTGYGLITTSFTKYFSLGWYTTGELVFDVRYPIALPANQRLTLRSYIKVNPTGSSFYATLANDTVTNKDGDRVPVRSVLNHMDYRITYHVKFHPQWAYESDVRFRFNGGTKVVGVKADSLEAIKESFSIRWNNTLYFSNASGFGGYLMFRYQPEKILMGATNVKHTVSFLAGISYAYDLSAL